jgi:hypothetical protein
MVETYVTFDRQNRQANQLGRAQQGRNGRRHHTHKNRQRTGGMDGRVPAVVVRNLHGARTKQQDGAFSNTGGGLSAKAYGERRPPPCPVVLIGRFAQQQRLRCHSFGCIMLAPNI